MHRCNDVWRYARGGTDIVAVLARDLLMVALSAFLELVGLKVKQPALVQADHRLSTH